MLLLNISMAYGNRRMGVTTLKLRVLEILQAREEGGATRTTQAIHSKKILAVRVERLPESFPLILRLGSLFASSVHYARFALLLAGELQPK